MPEEAATASYDVPDGLVRGDALTTLTTLTTLSAGSRGRG
jgi:hypothetical protein